MQNLNQSKKITVKVTRIARAIYRINFILQGVEMPEELAEFEGKVVNSGDMVGVAARAEAVCFRNSWEFETKLPS